MSERIKVTSWFMAGINSKKIKIMIKLSTITSVDGVEPRKRPTGFYRNSMSKASLRYLNSRRRNLRDSVRMSWKDS